MLCEGPLNSGDCQISPGALHGLLGERERKHSFLCEEDIEVKMEVGGRWNCFINLLE